MSSGAAQANEVEDIVRKVLAQVRGGGMPAKDGPSGKPRGVFKSVSDAVGAARLAQKTLVAMPLEKRREIVASIRKFAAADVHTLAKMAVDETGLGRVEDKIKKNLLVIHRTPGPEILEPIAGKWASAAGELIEVPEMPAEIDLAASIAKGRELFHGDKANCVKCHGVTALGDGQANDYDDWNKNIVKIETKLAALATGDADAEERRWAAEFHEVLDGDALKPRMIQPRNLRHGIYRGGRRPLDLYYRIHAGINGAPMPAAKGTVPPEDIWHIVNYVRSLPYELDGELGADKPMLARDRF